MLMTSKFPGTCKACNAPISVGERIDYQRGVGARHASATQCEAAKARAAAAPAAARPTPVAIDQRAIADFLNAAKARGLKCPKARFLKPGGGEMRLHLAGDTSSAPGAVQVKAGDTWLGRINVDGTVVGRSLTGDAELLAALSSIAADPAKAAKEYGALMSRCSFCSLPLTDAGSVEFGYGATCAKKWGLPHVAKGSALGAAAPAVAVEAGDVVLTPAQKAAATRRARLAAAA